MPFPVRFFSFFLPTLPNGLLSPFSIDGCGGEGTCGTCHVILDEATFAAAGKVGKTEANLLQKIKGVKPTYALSSDCFDWF